MFNFKKKMKKDNKKDNENNILTGVAKGSLIFTISSLKDDDTTYNTTVNDLIGSNDTIDIVKFIKESEEQNCMDLEKIEGISNELMDWLFADDDRTSIANRGNKIMNSYGGKQLFSIAFGVLSLQCLYYVDTVFRYKVKLDSYHSHSILSDFFKPTLICMGLIGLFQAITKLPVSPIVYAMQPILFGSSIILNILGERRLIDSVNGASPKELLARTDKLDKYKLFDRCISDITDYGMEEKPMNYVTGLYTMADGNTAIINTVVEEICK